MSLDAANTRPTRPSGGLAVLAGLAAVAALGTAGIEPALAAEAVALVLLVGGFGLVHRGRRLVGAVTVAIGLVGVCGSLAAVWVLSGDPLAVLQFAPGMIGLCLLALGVAPVRGRGSRGLVQAGAGAVLVTVLLAGIVSRPPLWALLLSGVATIAAWDAGENAIGVGEQLGRRAETGRTEAVHAAATAVVAGVGVLAGLLVRDVGTSDLPLGAVIASLIGIVLLAGALHD